MARCSVAIVHDFLYCYSGAERVLEQIIKVFPQADLFALFDFLPPERRGFLQGKSVKTTFIQRMPFARRNHRVYLPLIPLAIEQLDVSAYDIVISSSYLAAKGVLIRPDQLHICYCHTPVRYAWDLQHVYLRQSGLATGIRSFLIRALMHYIRNWDVRSANGVDCFVANSDFVARRIEKVYRRPSTTIYPPVDVGSFALRSGKSNFYITASRMVPYKKVDLIVRAFAQMPDRRLIVVGDGPDYRKACAHATPNVEFLGFQPMESLVDYMRRAKAFVFAAEEDFGIVAVEAMACGTPVIAYGRGGALESVADGRSGILFAEQTVDSIVDALRRFESRGVAWDAGAISEAAQRFCPRRFRDEFSAFVDKEWGTFCTRRPHLTAVPSFVSPEQDEGPVRKTTIPEPATRRCASGVPDEELAALDTHFTLG